MALTAPQLALLEELVRVVTTLAARTYGPGAPEVDEARTRFEGLLAAVAE